MDDVLLELVVCPITRKKLRREGEFLVTEEGVKYPIKDDLPVLVPSAAILPPPYQSVEAFKAAMSAR